MDHDEADPAQDAGGPYSHDVGWPNRLMTRLDTKRLSAGRNADEPNSPAWLPASSSAWPLRRDNVDEPQAGGFTWRGAIADEPGAPSLMEDMDSATLIAGDPSQSVPS